MVRAVVSSTMTMSQLITLLLLSALFDAEGLENYSGESSHESNVTDSFFDFVKSRIRKHQCKKDDCMVKLVEETINQNGSTFLFITDNHIHETLLENLQSSFVYSYYTEPNKLTLCKHVSFHHLIIFHTNVNLEEVILQLGPIQSTKFFVIVKNYEEVVETFEMLWKYRIINAVASFVVNKTFYFYTYTPYCSSHCGEVGKPYLVARCDISSGIFSHREQLFPQKATDLHRCPINITFADNIPSSYYTPSREPAGWEIELMNMIIEHLNGVPRYEKLLSRKLIYNKSTGYGRLVRDSEVGIGMVVSLKGLTKTDFCMYGLSVCITWVVPKRIAPHSAEFLCKVFPIKVWLLLLFCYFLMAASFRILFKVPISNVLFKLLPYILGTTTRTKKTSKVLAASWLWFCVIMTAIYQSGFQSTLLVPDLPPQLSTTKDVLESNLKILGVSDLITAAIPYYKHRYNISSNRLISVNRKITYDEWVYRMTVKKDTAFLGFRETVRYHIERTELANKLYIPDNCIIKYMLSFVLRKNSHLTEHFIRFSNRINENGFVVFFVRKHLSKESWSFTPEHIAAAIKPPKGCGVPAPSPIDMHKMNVVFIFHVVGLMVASVAFFIEIISKWKCAKIFKCKKIFKTL